MRLKLTNDRQHYVLEVTSDRAITLSLHEMDVLTMLVDRLREQVGQSSSLVEVATATTRISNAIVGTDLHRSEVILKLQDRGFEHAYTLSPETAQGLRDGINFQLIAI